MIIRNFETIKLLTDIAKEDNLTFLSSSLTPDICYRDDSSHSSQSSSSSSSSSQEWSTQERKARIMQKIDDAIATLMITVNIWIAPGRTSFFLQIIKPLKNLIAFYRIPPSPTNKWISCHFHATYKICMKLLPQGIFRIFVDIPSHTVLGAIPSAGIVNVSMR